jgi:sulfur dioxygenase
MIRQGSMSSRSSMIFRQLFERESSTYSYLVASRPGGEALLIDPVLEHTDQYLQLLRELDVRLTIAIDTHVHADHVTALGALRDAVHCSTVMGAETKADCVSRRVADDEVITSMASTSAPSTLRGTPTTATAS